MRTLWTVGGILLLLNGFLYWRAWTGQNNRQGALQNVEARIVELKEREKNIKSAISDIRIDELNARVNYLNGKLAERTFGWSQLFDRLSEVLPNDVRLHQLRPLFSLEEDTSADFVFTGDRVDLLLSGSAKTDEEILALIDGFFKHDSFKRPSIQTESKTDGGEVEWSMSVVYLPLVVSASDEAVVPEAAVEGEPSGNDTGGGQTGLPDETAEMIPVFDPDSTAAEGEAS